MTSSADTASVAARRRARPAPARALSLLALTLAAAAAALAQQGAPAPPAPAAKDGPTRITFQQVFKEGKTDFDEYDPAKVAPMPRGYVGYRGEGYKVETDAVVAGTHVIDFAVPSAADREVFDSLRVLCAEWDKVDEKLYWADCTIDAPDAAARDFAARRLSARTEHSGMFALARLVSSPRLSYAAADLSVEVVAPKGHLVADRELSFDVRVANRGPGDAYEIAIQGAGFASNEFVSASGPERGRCKQDGSNYACKLDHLAPGETAVFRIVLKPWEPPRVRPTEAHPFSLDALVFCRQPDPNLDNNHADSSVAVFPDPNAAPTLKLLGPADQSVFDAAAEIRLSAEASDPDGQVAKLEFYDADKLIGAGRPEGNNVYTLDWKGASPGMHLLTVFVADDGGRGDYQNVSVFVNGPLRVSVRGPRPGAVFGVKTKGESENQIEAEPLDVEATAGVAPNGRNVKEVTFVLTYGTPVPYDMRKEVARPAGVDRATGETLYAATFKGMAPGSYYMTAVATDEAGVKSIAHGHFSVRAAPLVRLEPERNPVTTYRTPTPVPLVAKVLRYLLLGEMPGKMKVDFYADGNLIGSAETNPVTDEARLLWADATPGTHNVTAVATDAEGVASPQSGPLLITIRKQ